MEALRNGMQVGTKMINSRLKKPKKRSEEEGEERKERIRRREKITNEGWEMSTQTATAHREDDDQKPTYIILFLLCRHSDIIHPAIQWFNQSINQRSIHESTSSFLFPASSYRHPIGSHHACISSWVSLQERWEVIGIGLLHRLHFVEFCDRNDRRQTLTHSSLIIAIDWMIKLPNKHTAIGPGCQKTGGVETEKEMTMMRMMNEEDKGKEEQQQAGIIATGWSSFQTNTSQSAPAVRRQAESKSRRERRW